MFNKKGIHYVDWVISMGTFIIAVIAILIYIKPGVKPEYNKESLLNMVETNFLNETNWVIRKIPLFIRNLDQQYSINQDAFVQLSYSNGFSLDVDTPGNIIQDGSKLKCNIGSCSDITVNLTIYPNNPLNKIGRAHV